MYPFLPYPGIPILLHTLSVLLPFSFFPNNNGTISLKLMMPSNSWQLRITILMLLSPPSTSPPRYCYLNRLPSTMDKHSSLIITFINTTYVTSLAHQSSNRDFRQLFSTFNGDAFYPLSVWPQDFKLIFWKKPIIDKDTFKLFLFLGVGNGCSPNLISRWILTSQHWTSDKKAEKRARQLDFLLNNKDNKSHLWVYYYYYFFDLHNEQWLYLNGQKRATNNWPFKYSFNWSFWNYRLCSL